MARVAGTAAAEAALMKALYDEHAAVLWRYALRLTGDASQAEDVVQETLLRAWQHPEVVGDTERSARAWLFTVARNMIIDDRRSARFRNVVGSLDESGAPEQSTPDEVNAALDRLLIADAMAQLSAEHRAVIERVVLPRLDHRADCCRPRDRRGNSEVATTLRRAGVAAHSAGTWGYPLRGSECLKVMRKMDDMKTPLRAIGPPDDPYAMWDAAYVLGSLSAAERREFEAHLAHCPACRGAVADLSGVPALLSQLGRDEVAAINDSDPAGMSATPRCRRSCCRRCWLRCAGAGAARG